MPFSVNAHVNAGDQVAFRVNMHGNIGWDTTAFDPTIAYADGETHVASREFSGKQGQSGWRYQYLEGGRFVDLVFYPDHKQWRKEKDNATGTPFVGPGDQHPAHRSEHPAQPHHRAHRPEEQLRHRGEAGRRDRP